VTREPDAAAISAKRTGANKLARYHGKTSIRCFVLALSRCAASAGTFVAGDDDIVVAEIDGDLEIIGANQSGEVPLLLCQNIR
jgi:hypothetical protein